MDFARGMAARTVSGEIRPSFGVENGLRHDRAGRISRAEEQDVVVVAHTAPVDLIAARRTTTGLVCDRRFDGADKAAEELAVNLIGIELDGNVPPKKFQGILRAIDSGGLDLDLSETSLCQLGFVFRFIEGSGNAADPCEHTMPNLWQDLSPRNHIRNGKTPAGLQDAKCLPQHLSFIRRKIDDAVRDDHIYGIVRQRYAFDFAL